MNSKSECVTKKAQWMILTSEQFRDIDLVCSFLWSRCGGKVMKVKILSKQSTPDSWPNHKQCTFSWQRASVLTTQEKKIIIEEVTSLLPLVLPIFRILQQVIQKGSNPQGHNGMEVREVLGPRSTSQDGSWQYVVSMQERVGRWQRLEPWMASYADNWIMPLNLWRLS